MRGGRESFTHRRRGARGVALRAAVFLDDASDDTASRAALTRAALMPNTCVMRSEKRRGKAANLRDALREAAAADEAVACLDCDIVASRATLLALAEGTRTADLTTAGALALATPRSWVERGLIYASHFHHELRRRCADVRPAFCVIGRAVALSPRAVRLLASEKLPIHTEDAFMAMRIAQAGYSLRFLPRDVVYYRAPATLSDHEKQSRRFIEGTALMRGHFGETAVSRTLVPSTIDMLAAFATTALRRPIGSLLYVALTACTKFGKPPAPSSGNGGWAMSRSTKSL